MAGPQTENEDLWRSYLTGKGSPIRRLRAKYKRWPGRPRCGICLMPLGGALAPAYRLVTRRTRSNKNPNRCNFCEELVRTKPGGVEIELSFLFADVRGSTTLAEGMRPGEFTQVMNRFYESSNRILIDSEAMVDKLVGDEVIGLYLPNIGPDHAAKAIRAARDLLVATGHAESGGPWVPVGAGVHTGLAYVGAVGSTATIADFTAMGDSVNVAARLSSVAREGEVLISEAAAIASGLELGDLETRRLDLKGRREPIEVRVMNVAPGAASPRAVS
jgi:adenylate cyclase